MSNLEQVDQPTRFVGRETELSETKQILKNADCRLLTLIGVGGIGKTRLAIRLAKDQQQAFAGGVWFINLQPLQSGKQIVSAVVDAMGVVLSGYDSPENQLLQYLQDKNLLLLLDNFEHVLDGVEFVTQIIQRAPAVKLLVTSREALSLPEEWLYPVEGLPFPLSHQIDNVESITAVELFVERARQVDPNFSLAGNRASVVRICQLVDGLPLALEMAASWTKTLRCSEIAAEIQHNLNFLTSNLRHVPERHRSMQAVFAQTWDHLTESEQALFKRLAVFKGGFRREAAELIAGASLPLLSSLLDKCLLRREAGGRYQIHELLRQYANGKLDETEIKALAEAHCRYYCDFLAQRKPGLIEREQVKNSLEIEGELENIRTAWQYAVDHKQIDSLRKAAAPYFYFCQMQSRYLEYVDASSLAVDVLEAAGDLPGLAQVLVFQGWMLIRIGRFEQAAKGLERSKALFKDLRLTPDYGMGSHPLAPLVVLTVIQGDYTRAVALGQQLKFDMAASMDKQNLGFACYGLTSAYLNLGQDEAALKNAEEAIKLFAEIGNHWMSAYGHIELGNVHQAMGHYAGAERHYRESLRIRKDYRDPEGIAVAAKHLGEISLLQHDYQAARQLYEQSLSIYQRLNDQGGLAAAHHGLGQVAYQAGAADLAAHHFREALDIADKINFIPLLLSLLIDIAALMLANDLKIRGLELLRLVHNHPASNQQQQKKAASLLKSSSSNNDASIPDLKTTISALQTELLDFVPVSPAAPGSALIEPLTDRELEVLRLIVQGLSNPVIAEKLFISTGTVKAHTNRIYGKLGVTNRVEAVTKAQELSLL
ncbi:MAG: tetratricopeptide repeat protein [Anaerolineae bacterium]|nr:tetratricopeptide repeat protein [Anaerolineae bacterium]